MQADNRSLALRSTKDKFRISGEPSVWKTTKTDSGKEARRYFCSKCGTQMWAECDAYPDMVTIKVSCISHGAFGTGLAQCPPHQVGTLDDYADVTLAVEVFTLNAIKSFQPA